MRNQSFLCCIYKIHIIFLYIYVYRHIGFSNPKRFYKEIEENCLIYEKSYIQNRRVPAKNFNTLCEGLLEYLMILRDKGISIFEIEGNGEDMIICYEAALLKIYRKI